MNDICHAEAEIAVPRCTCAGWDGRHESFCGTDVGTCYTELDDDGDCPNTAMHTEVLEARR